MGAAYAVGAWVIVQLTAIVGPELKFPEGTLSIVLIMAVVGLPIAIMLSWIYELTPQGFKSDAAAIRGIGPARSPFNGCNLQPGMFMSCGRRATSKRCSCRVNLAA